MQNITGTCKINHNWWRKQAVEMELGSLSAYEIGQLVKYGLKSTDLSKKAVYAILY